MHLLPAHGAVDVVDEAVLAALAVAEVDVAAVDHGIAEVGDYTRGFLEAWSKITIEAAMKSVSNKHDFELAMQQAGMTVPA